MDKQPIELKNVRVHNLKGIDLTLNPHNLIAFCGVSGSGKSSIAFDTLYVEGQRRYVESLSTFARRYLGDLAKPELDEAKGLSPTISIEQKTVGRNPRSTVGTLTEIYDYLRVLYARVGVPHCPISGERVAPQSKERIIKQIQRLTKGSKIQLLAPFATRKKGEFREDLQDLLRKGFMRVIIDGTMRLLTEEIELDRNLAHDIDIVIDRVTVEEHNHSRIAEGVEQALALGDGMLKLLEGETTTLYSTHAYSEASGESYKALEPHDFSFNSPSGMCSECHGMGRVQQFDLDKIIDPTLSIAKDCCLVAPWYETVKYRNIFRNLGKLFGFTLSTPWKKLSKEAKQIFLYGTKQKWTRMTFTHPKTKKRWEEYVRWRGVLHEVYQRYQDAKSASYKKRMEQWMIQGVCPSCKGSRLKAYPTATTVNDHKIDQITRMTVVDAKQFFDELTLEPDEMLIADELLKEIRQRLQFLLDVGLDYLALDRTAPTLSGGEAQRVRLASQIGCGLVGVTYILDEPSIGLHPRDNKRLIQTLQSLRDKGNTVIVVEHDEETLRAADRVIDFGPGAGVQGGEIVYDGSVTGLMKCKKSLTGGYLSGRLKMHRPEKLRKKGKPALKVKKANFHNLKNVSVDIPLGLLVAVTGVSGSGKSSLISGVVAPSLANQTLTGSELLDKTIEIDQSPIGRNPRSNPATYIKLWDDIRDLFTELPESKARGYKAGRFSFNVRDGSCHHCGGMGQLKVDMDFLESAWVECQLCQGRRFDQETLSVLYKGKSIFDVLEMEVGKALEFFEAIPQIRKKLHTLHEVGLDYMKLGQPSTTLSGGEAQRIKLAKELVRPATGKTLYILDEPTTGLHFHDIQALLKVMHALVDRGNSIIVIEHNMDVVKNADWIIDIGPEGGDAGGKIVATGTPDKISKMDTPTGHALQEKLPATCGKESKSAPLDAIVVEGAKMHNLKHIDVSIPRGKMSVCTGPSGSGKSSFAFDTLYAEGQRRYIESLSPYARQFVKQSGKPQVTKVEGLSPSVAIEQKAHAGNPRSTVGTLTEIYDFLRVLYARKGQPHCPETQEPIKAISKEHVVERILHYPQGEKIHLLAPIKLSKSENFQEICARFLRQGYLRIRLNGQIHSIEEQIPFDRRRKNKLELVVDRLKVSPSIKQRLFEAVEHATQISDGTLIVLREEEEVFFNLDFCAPSTGKSYPEITPQTFAFNTAHGMCPECQGLGVQYGLDLEKNEQLTVVPIAQLLDWFLDIDGWTAADLLLRPLGIAPFDTLDSMTAQQRQLFLNGSDSFNKKAKLQIRWMGLNAALSRLAKIGRKEAKEATLPLLNETDCPSCQGSRLNPLASHVTLNNVSLGTLCAYPVEKTLSFIKKLSYTDEEQNLLGEVQEQLINRLTFLTEVGLDYLSLNRKAPTLSGGETQRIRLAKQLGSSLTGVLYVLDEPTIGLHPYDNDKLLQVLQKLKALGNTLLLVEHDPATIAHADYLLDFGPESGTHGGHIVAKGTPQEVAQNKESLTGLYLSGDKQIPVPDKRKVSDFFTLSKTSKHNLKALQPKIPKQVLSVLTGVSGSGKSTLMSEIINELPEEFDRTIIIDQQPIGHTRRATVATYTDLYTSLRHFFSQLPEASILGLQPGNFSYNSRKGMCSHCWGIGHKRIEMHFLPPVKITCPECQGHRLNPLALEVRYKGKNLGEHMLCTVEEALVTFGPIPKARRILETLIKVGLGYLPLGQTMQTLSGGEAQRIKLASELYKRTRGKALYLLDEPTTGLHYEDVKKLLQVLHQIVDKGHTMVIIEHNLDVIRNADWILDLGPAAGEKGGKIIAEGPPSKIARSKTSVTGKYLKEKLCLI